MASSRAGPWRALVLPRGMTVSPSPSRCSSRSAPNSDFAEEPHSADEEKLSSDAIEVRWHRSAMVSLVSSMLAHRLTCRLPSLARSPRSFHQPVAFGRVFISAVGRPRVVRGRRHPIPVHGSVRSCRHPRLCQLPPPRKAALRCPPANGRPPLQRRLHVRLAIDEWPSNGRQSAHEDDSHTSTPPAHSTVTWRDGTAARRARANSSPRSKPIESTFRHRNARELRERHQIKQCDK